MRMPACAPMEAPSDILLPRDARAVPDRPRPNDARPTRPAGASTPDRHGRPAAGAGPGRQTRAEPRQQAQAVAQAVAQKRATAPEPPTAPAPRQPGTLERYRADPHALRIAVEVEANAARNAAIRAFLIRLFSYQQ